MGTSQSALSLSHSRNQSLLSISLTFTSSDLLILFLLLLLHLCFSFASTFCLPLLQELHNNSFPANPEFHYGLLTHADNDVPQQSDSGQSHWTFFIINSMILPMQPAGHSLVGDTLLWLTCHQWQCLTLCSTCEEFQCKIETSNVEFIIMKTIAALLSMG